MHTYRCEWRIDVSAETPEEAAKKAEELMRGAWLSCWTVIDEHGREQNVDVPALLNREASETSDEDDELAQLSYENVFRAHVAPPAGPEWTCFVEASSREAAWQKIRSLTEHDVYNLHSAQALIAQGESEDPELRLFEVAWGGGKPPRFCEHPVFLLPNPGDWARKWAAAIEREDAKTATALWRER